MKTIYSLLFAILILFSASGCSGKKSGQRNARSESDSVLVPDTGYTGIKKYLSNGKVLKEVSFKNGVRCGETKTFYKGGQTYQTFWYENNLREDSAIWYYAEGQVFRTTPFRHDTIHGIQKQFFRNGVIKAKIGYDKGLRNTLFEEYTQEGKLIKSYPEIVVKINDEYNISGNYRIGLELSDKSAKVQFFRGEFTGGRFDTTKISAVNTVKGKGTVSLRKTGTPTSGKMGVIAEIITPYGNRHLVYKEIRLPYQDLK